MNLPSACPLCPSAMNKSKPYPCMWWNAIGIPVSTDAIEKICWKRIKWAAADCDVVNACAMVTATGVNNLTKTRWGSTYTASVHHPKLPSQTLPIHEHAWDMSIERHFACISCADMKGNMQMMRWNSSDPGRGCTSTQQRYGLSSDGWWRRYNAPTIIRIRFKQ